MKDASSSSKTAANVPSKAAKRVQPIEVIEIESDDEDPSDEEEKFEAELRRAMALSKVDSVPSTAASSRPASIPPSTAQVNATPALTNNPLLFDRKKLEEERLARQKRLRPEIQQSTANASDEDDDEDDERQRDNGAKRQRLSSSLPSARRANATSSSDRRAMTSNAAGSSSNPQESLFWNGELRQTANKHVDADKDTRPLFRLTEIIGQVSRMFCVATILLTRPQKDDITFAILSAYVVDQAWIYQLFEIRTPVILVAQDAQGI